MPVHYIDGDTPYGFTEVSTEFATAVCHQVPEEEEPTTFEEVVIENNRVKNNAERK